MRKLSLHCPLQPWHTSSHKQGMEFLNVLPHTFCTLYHVLACLVVLVKAEASLRHPFLKFCLVGLQIAKALQVLKMRKLSDGFPLRLVYHITPQNSVWYWLRLDIMTLVIFLGCFGQVWYYRWSVGLILSVVSSAIILFPLISIVFCVLLKCLNALNREEASLGPAVSV